MNCTEIHWSLYILLLFFNSKHELEDGEYGLDLCWRVGVFGIDEGSDGVFGLLPGSLLY
jgi:hypothetical protein